MVELTPVMVSWMLVVVFAGKVMVVAAPLLLRVPTATVLPSENLRFPAVIWSAVLGRS